MEKRVINEKNNAAVRATLHSYCVQTDRNELLAQWHPEKNGELTPQGVTAFSSKKVWWICEKGHEYQASVASRTNGRTGCPVCSGTIPLEGVNDLSSKFPQIAEEWHPAKNGELTPQGVTAFSSRKVWWRCEAGHEYQATIAHRTLGSSKCPYCSGQKVLAGYNDLAAKHPHLAEQWQADLNGDLTPEMVTPGSNKKVWWQCSEGHVWQAAVYSRTCGRKSGCPVCAGKISKEKKARYDQILAEINILKK